MGIADCCKRNICYTDNPPGIPWTKCFQASSSCFIHTFNPYTDYCGEICPPVAGQSSDLYSPQSCQMGLPQRIPNMRKK